LESPGLAERMTCLLILLLMVFGALGSVARYGLQGLIQERVGAGFPAGTLSVNVIGSCVLGLVLRLSLDRLWIPPEWRTILTIGFLGAFTTFSTFSWEAFRMLEDGEWGKAGLYVGASLLGGLLGVMLGIKIADLI
jgi:fluoride exporter